MGTQLVVQPREILALPTAQWFDEIGKYRTLLREAGFDVRKVLESTLQFTIRATSGNNHSLQHFHAFPVRDYQNFLTLWLMEMDTEFHERTPANFVAVVAEVSTHFYQQLTELFKEWNLTSYQVRSMAIWDWAGDDMLVEVYI